MSDWQPIETAPKDGTNILLFEDGDVYQGAWENEYVRYRPLFLGYHGCGCCGGGDMKPSHWMPLPEPPK